MSNSHNRLGNETSLYLLQHADNPVHWYPWGDEALEQARQADKPILLSIGYSACHWCHVMAHESFEDPAVAAQMNADFINIKVDREERPDIDKIYQLAHQLLSQRGGGWPLTVALDPQDLGAFFVGTYFPPQPRHGMPSFSQLLGHLSEAWRDRRDQIQVQNGELKRVLLAIDAVSTDDQALEGESVSTTVAQAFKGLQESFDAREGGFGAAPKFPHPAFLQFLQLRHARLAEEPETGDGMLRETLAAMARGGIYDQLGGGFCRYAVDHQWRIPHFEKMLYDNGQLLRLYAWESIAGGSDDALALLFAATCRQTVAWVARRMQAASGGLFASLDADSEGREGAYYAWSGEQLNKALADLDETSADRLRQHLGFDQAANFEGQWHPYAAFDDRESSLAAAKVALLALRQQRPRPTRDEKIIAAWNGLAISGLATCGRLLQMPEATDLADQALAFARQEMVSEGRLYAVWSQGRLRFPAYLDDHSHLLLGALDLLEARWSDDTLSFAIWLADQLLEHFRCPDSGAFYFTAHDHERLLVRQRPMADDAVANGNAVAAQCLITLGHLLGETRYLNAAQSCLQAGWSDMQRSPQGHMGMLDALQLWHQPDHQLLVQCAAAEVARIRQELAESARRWRRDFVIPLDRQAPAQPPLTVASDTPMLARACHRGVCALPMQSEAELRAYLEQQRRTRAAD